MKRLATVDWLLIGTLLPVLVLGVVLTIVHGRRGDFVFPTFMVSSAPDAHSYPIVREVFAPSSMTGEIAVGDAVRRMDGVDLQGMSTAAVALRWSAAARAGAHSLRVETVRAGVPAEIDDPLVPGALAPSVPWWAPLPLMLTFAVTGSVLLIRAAHRRLARRFYLECLLFALAHTPYFHLPTVPWATFVSTVVGLPLIAGLVLWTTCELIPGAQLWGPRMRVLTWVLCLWLSATWAASLWLPDAGVGALLMRSGPVASAGLLIAVLAVLTLGYLRADPLGRRQIKWIVYGVYVGSVPVFGFYAVYAAGVRAEWVSLLLASVIVAFAATPLGVLVAIAFYQFLDIDRLFGATLSYSVLAIVGLAVALGLMPAVARAASDTLGLDPTSGQLLFSVVLASVLVSAQRIVRPRIDTLLFPERVTLQQGFQRLLADLSTTADMAELTRVLGDRLDTLLRPVSAVVYARSGDLFTPLAARGRPAPPAFTARSSLIATLEECPGPLGAERWTAQRRASLSPFERAAIETLDAAVLVPIRRGADLVAFACLGPKRSGDIYTPTDLALLGAVAGKVSDRLLALDASAVAEQARAMQNALRRFVPGPVAERIVSGQSLADGKREVTVLFVDIRGYTNFSEPREVDEIFHTVNRYTETASALVHARGGVVVEFHGDGLLAIFGAPGELEMKECAAVQVAREIVVAIPALRDGGAGDETRLSVGVGVATGPAFVGNIQSADRAIWTVLGNPVNLAARLQSLTRELAASIAIDDTTFRRATHSCRDFVHHDHLAIHGRTTAERVHTLPLSA